MNSDTALLHALARAHGVQTSFVMMSGERKDARPEALVAVLNALGVAAKNKRQIADSIAEHEANLCTRCLEPVTVAWDRKPARVRLHLSGNRDSAAISGEIRLEDGTRKRIPRLQVKLLAEVQSDRSRRFISEVTLPALPFGYHELTLNVGSKSFTSFVISAPRRSYSRGQRRDWGLFLPMYAARSDSGWGTGNLGDWRKLCDWAAARGANVVGTLPLLAAFLDHPKCDPSPYSPASRLFWNEFYLDIEAIPEFHQCDAAKKLVAASAFQKRLERFRKNRLVDYCDEWQTRRQVLERLADEFFSKRTPRFADFERFVRSRPELEDYARFRAVCDKTNQSWHVWPARLRNGRLKKGDFDDRTRRFHLYIQWLAQEQIDSAIAHCRERGVQFYLDLPLGVHPDGYDVWRERDSFALNASAGAPPDSFFTLGQNWSFAPLHPQRIREQRYRYVIDYLRFQMRHTGLLRIDHVMGLHRLYWIPEGFDPTDGVYVSYNAEEMHAILSLESHRHKTSLIGENLGTVPPEVNDAMHRHGMRGMYVVQYQQRADANNALENPVRQTVASLNTHDLPTFAAHWKGLEILDHAKLGLVEKDEVTRKRSERRKLNQALATFLRSKHLLKGKADLENTLHAVLNWLAASPTEIVLVNLEDLLLEEQPQNMPGTYLERPNWRRKAAVPLEEIFGNRKIAALLKRITARRKMNARNQRSVTKHSTEA